MFGNIHGTGVAVIMADDQSVQMVRVYYPAPLSGSFEGRVVKQSLTIDNAGISVAKLRAEWMASLGHSDNPVAQPEESVPPQ